MLLHVPDCIPSTKSDLTTVHCRERLVRHTLLLRLLVSVFSLALAIAQGSATAFGVSEPGLIGKEG